MSIMRTEFKGQMTRVAGRQIALQGGRSVFVGEVDGRDDVYLQFKNGSAVLRVVISREAMHALRSLLYIDEQRGEPKEYNLGAGMRAWQVVKEIDA